MISVDDTLPLGIITKTHGTRGELQCALQSDIWENTANVEFLALNIENILVPFRLEEWWYKNDDNLILQLKDIDDENSAKQLTGFEVRVFKSDLNGDVDSDDLLGWQDLTGFHLFDADGRDRGRIVYVDESTANITATVESGLMFPLHEDLMLMLDKEKKQLQLNAIGI